MKKLITCSLLFLCISCSESPTSDTTGESSSSGNENVSSEISSQEILSSESETSTSSSEILSSLTTSSSVFENVSSQDEVTSSSEDNLSSENEMLSSSVDYSSSDGQSVNSSEGNSSDEISDSVGLFMDMRDSAEYGWTKIGDQIWMSENLNYRPSSGSYCYDATYSGSSVNCNYYGRLYTWDALMAGELSSDSAGPGPKGICPEGWHVPSDGEWEMLAEFIAGQNALTDRNQDDWPGVGGFLKANSNLWSSGSFSDEYGFGALPGGYRNSDKGGFYNESYNGYYWTATEPDNESAYRRSFAFNDDYLWRTAAAKGNAFSLRCVSSVKSGW
jgi:uncharacterized protein (TIGR02145 family)